jgi:hypothetical protein
MLKEEMVVTQYKLFLLGTGGDSILIEEGRSGRRMMTTGLCGVA